MKIQSTLLLLILSGNLYIGNAQTPKVFNKEASSIYLPITTKENDFGTAKDYVLGEKVSGNVSKKVFFAVDLTAGVYRAFLNFDPLRTGNVKLNIHIYDRPDYGSVIAKSNLEIAPKDLPFIVPVSGRYYILISLYKIVGQEVSANFDFTLKDDQNPTLDSVASNNVFEQAQLIQINERIFGLVNPNLDQRDFYRIQLEQEKRYAATLKFDSSADLDLYVYLYPNYDIGSRIASSTGLNNPERVLFATQNVEWHYIVVIAQTPGNRPYELIITEQ